MQTDAKEQEAISVAAQSAKTTKAVRDRGVTVLRVAKLITPGAERLCLVRSISPLGLHATFEEAIIAGERVAVELGADRLEGRIAKVDGSSIEMAFDAPVEVARLMGDGEAWTGTGRRTAPRVEIDCRARLKVGSETLFVGVRDISQDGMRIESSDILFAGDQIAITLHAFNRPIHGVVRWCRDGGAGIAFHEPLALKALTRWLADCGATHDDIRGIARQ